ncbi:MAG: acyl-CoA reductase [Candidatus Hermodarchaeota archaeon]
MESVLDKTQRPTSVKVFHIPIIARGKVIEDYAVEFGGRHGAAFVTPDAKKYLQKIALTNPAKLKDLYALSMEEILDFLHDLGQRLVLKENEYLQDAFDLACEASGLTPSILRTMYDALPLFFEKAAIREMLDKRIGIHYLEDWVPTELNDGRTVSIRAFGARGVHIIAGNVPLVAAGTLIRSCSTRSDTIIKLPSNDPLTATALARTMIDMDPSHPITQHVCVAYWKGGDTEFETSFYRPEYIEKIVVWGGFASIKHITRYLQPGIDLITLDPKLSTSIIGAEAFADPQTTHAVARRAAIDVGAYNQEACVNSRVMYVQSGTDEAGIERLNQFGACLYSELMNLPPNISTPPKQFDPELKAQLEALLIDDEFYRVYGGQQDEGSVIVSQFDEPVDFSHKLCCRVVNLVPIDNLQTAVKSVNAYTQTVGIFPEQLKQELRDDLILHGVQRIVSLGFAPNGSLVTPQDALEPLRRMCKWVMDEASVNT